MGIISISRLMIIGSNYLNDDTMTTCSRRKTNFLDYTTRKDYKHSAHINIYLNNEYYVNESHWPLQPITDGHRRLQTYHYSTTTKREDKVLLESEGFPESGILPRHSLSLITNTL